MSLQTAKTELTNTFLELQECGCVSEFDSDIIYEKSAAVIKEMAKSGECWLVKVNLYKDTDKPLKKYDRERIYNFCACAAIPEFSQELQDLILARKYKDYTGTKQDYVSVGAIFEKIDELGGILLHWS